MAVIKTIYVTSINLNAECCRFQLLQKSKLLAWCIFWCYEFRELVAYTAIQLHPWTAFSAIQTCTLKSVGKDIALAT